MRSSSLWYVSLPNERCPRLIFWAVSFSHFGWNKYLIQTCLCSLTLNQNYLMIHMILFNRQDFNLLQFFKQAGSNHLNCFSLIQGSNKMILRNWWLEVKCQESHKHTDSWLLCSWSSYTPGNWAPLLIRIVGTSGIVMTRYPLFSRADFRAIKDELFPPHGPPVNTIQMTLMLLKLNSVWVEWVESQMSLCWNERNTIPITQDFQ